MNISNSALLISTVLMGSLMAQGSLTPLGAPAASMRSLTQIYDAMSGLQLPASALVELASGNIAAGATKNLGQLTSSGGFSTFAVPARKVLIITDIDVFPNSYSSVRVFLVLHQTIASSVNSRSDVSFLADRPFNWNSIRA